MSILAGTASSLSDSEGEDLMNSTILLPANESIISYILLPAGRTRVLYSSNSLVWLVMYTRCQQLAVALKRSLVSLGNIITLHRNRLHAETIADMIQYKH